MHCCCVFELRYSRYHSPYRREEEEVRYWRGFCGPDGQICWKVPEWSMCGGLSSSMVPDLGFTYLKCTIGNRLMPHHLCTWSWIRCLNQFQQYRLRKLFPGQNTIYHSVPPAPGASLLSSATQCWVTSLVMTQVAVAMFFLEQEVEVGLYCADVCMLLFVTVYWCPGSPAST